jgi:hypothetical protein
LLLVGGWVEFDTGTGVKDKGPKAQSHVPKPVLQIRLLMVVAPWAKARPLVVFRHDERLTDGAVEAEIMARSFGVH